MRILLPLLFGFIFWSGDFRIGSTGKAAETSRDGLLRNMLRYAGRDAAKPPASLPADFDQQLKAMGY